MAQEKSKPQTLPLYVTAPMSGACGCFAWCFSHPFELIKNRSVLAPESVTMAHISSNLIAEGGGVGGLWKGLSAGIARQLVYSSLRLAWYEPVKTVICGDREATLVDRLAAGAVSGSAAAAVSSPVEVALVVQTKSKEPVSVVTALSTVVQSSGVAGLWRGVGPLCARAAIVGISQVACYDQCKVWFNALNKNYYDNQASVTQVSLASGVCTGIFFASATMPVEAARVRMSAEQGATRRFTSMATTLQLIVKEQGVGAIFKGYPPYLTRCIVQTVVTFFVLDTAQRNMKKFWFAEGEK